MIILMRLIALVVCFLYLPMANASSQDEEILQLARSVIAKVRYGALITVDSEGQPRSRIVDAFAPDDHFVIYVATKPNTRKVKQIRGDNKVTLFYFDKADRDYVSVMGRASLVDDAEVKTAMRRAVDTDKIYPDFPKDYLLIRIDPEVVEGLLPGYRGDKVTWAPARVELRK